MSDTTHKMLADSLGDLVLVKVKGGRELRGRLKSFDQHLNLVLEDAEEVRGENSRKLGTIIVRGDNVIIISPASLSS